MEHCVSYQSKIITTIDNPSLLYMIRNKYLYCNSLPSYWLSLFKCIWIQNWCINTCALPMNEIPQRLNAWINAYNTLIIMMFCFLCFIHFRFCVLLYYADYGMLFYTIILFALSKE